MSGLRVNRRSFNDLKESCSEVTLMRIPRAAWHNIDRIRWMTSGAEKTRPRLEEGGMAPGQRVHTYRRAVELLQQDFLRRGLVLHGPHGQSRSVPSLFPEVSRSIYSLSPCPSHRWDRTPVRCTKH